MPKHLETEAPDGSRILYNQDVLPACCASLFDRQSLQARTTCFAKGRGTVLMFEHENLELVFKQYRRGGLLSRVVKDSYFYTRMEETRMWREFRLLADLTAMGLPVPRPVAARCEFTSGRTYRGELISERIPEARTLGEILAVQELSDATWARVGELIADFHRHHVYHADLNVNNILLDRHGGIYLIDFDKSRIWPSFRYLWARSNLQRLQRSLCKFARRLPGFHYSVDRWEVLKQGYTKGLTVSAKMLFLLHGSQESVLLFSRLL